MFIAQSKFDQHCIIQWYGIGKQRNQENFRNYNVGSQSIKPSYLSLSKAQYFAYMHEENRGDNRFASSYKINVNLFTPKSIPQDTTDLFLYGHSTVRRTTHEKFTRGISIGKHYVSSGKLALFLNEITPENIKKRNMRIWLLSCYSGRSDEYRYNERLAYKLNKLYGWTNKQIIAFSNPVSPNVLKECREIASQTKLFLPLNLETLNSKDPVSIMI